jgi:hypothetical protein
MYKNDKDKAYIVSSQMDVGFSRKLQDSPLVWEILFKREPLW